MDATAVQVIETIAIASESARKNLRDLFEFLVFLITLQSKAAK